MTRQKKWLLTHPVYHRLYQQRNKEKINARRRKAYQVSRGIYIEKDSERKYKGTTLIRQLKNVPCHDCGIKYPYFVMHFDHRDPVLKLRSLSKMATYGEKTIREEAAKCDVVCANCHAIRTHLAVENGALKIFGRYYVPN